MKQRVQAAPAVPKPQVVVPVRTRVFRQCACGGTCSSCNSDERIQRRALPGFDRANALPVSQPHDPAERDADRLADAALRATPSHEIAPATTPPGSGGEPLGTDVRDYFEPRFGRDLGGVRVHADAETARAARAFHAEAFTIGGDVHFGAGTYAPASERGRKLIAHELAHVVQQGVAPAVHRKPAADADLDIDELLPEQADADRELDEIAAQSVAAPAAARKPMSLWQMDHATHWSSFAERSAWVKSQMATAHFDSEYEQGYYAQVAAGVDVDAKQRPMTPTITPVPRKNDFRIGPAGGNGLEELRQDRSPTDESRFWFTQSYPKGTRHVHTIEITTARHPGGGIMNPDFMAPVILLSEGWSLQDKPDPSAGWNFDTYIVNRANNAKIPAQSLGGTRFRVLMGSAQCPGCHFGHGLEVDLFGSNFVIVLGGMALSGLGALGAGSEPLPMEAPPPPGGWGVRGVVPPPPVEVAPVAPAQSAPSTITSGAAMSGEGAYVGGAAAPKLDPVPRIAPAPAPPAPAPLKSVPLGAAPKTPITPITPGTFSPIVPLIAAQTAPSSSQTQPNPCPTGAKRVFWPPPVWMTAGYGDSGSLSPLNNRPSRFVIDRVKPPKRNRALIRQYLALPSNAALLARLNAKTLTGAVHHKWPLFLEGSDALPNLVFLDNTRHTAWHNTLHVQGKNGWMTFDPIGTKYCVY